MTKSNSLSGQATLSICHMAGMIDLAALPLWVGSLMKFYGLAAPQAGMTVTMFLGAVVISSVVFAPFFIKLNHRLFACLGFSVAACAFGTASLLPVAPESLTALMLLHGLAGFGVGMSLSVTHGVMGRTQNPHRLFGIANVAMAMLAIIMFATLPGIISTMGGRVIFQAFAVTMCFAITLALFFFPAIEKTEAELRSEIKKPLRKPLPKAAWLTIGTVVCLAFNQSLVFAFVERIGSFRGFSENAVQTVLVTTGFINLMPGLLAVVLQKRLSALNVAMAGPLLQGALALSITGASSLLFFAVPTVFYTALVIFTSTFLFGLLTQVDSSGRAVAATSAMTMVGSALGPALGGGVIAWVGYAGLGWTVVFISLVAAFLVGLTRKELTRVPLREAALPA